MTRTPLATWAQLTEKPEDGWLGEANPAATISMEIDRADEAEDDEFGDTLDDVDREALTAAWLDRIRQELRGVDIDGDLADDGTLSFPAQASEARQQHLIESVRRLINDVDPIAMTSMYRRTLTSGVIEIVNLDNGDATPPRVYEYGGDGKLRTATEVVTEAKAKYRAEYDLAAAVALGHSFNPRGNQPGPQQRGTLVMSVDLATLLHRTAVNEDGVEFHVDRFELETITGHFVVVLSLLDEDGMIDHEEAPLVLHDLNGWTLL